MQLNYTVATSYTFLDEVSPGLARIIRELNATMEKSEQLQAQLKRFNQELGAIGERDGLTRVDAALGVTKDGIGTAIAEMAKLNETIAGLGAEDGLTRVDGALGATRAEIDTTLAKIAELNTQVGEIGASRPPVPPAMPLVAGLPGAAAPGAAAAEEEEEAHAGGHGVLFGRTGARVQQRAGHGGIFGGAMAGVAGGAAGIATYLGLNELFEGVKNTFEDAKEIDTQLTLLRSFLTEAQVSEAAADAFKVRAPGVDPRGYLESLTILHAAFADYGKAKELAPYFAELSAYNKATGGHGLAFDEQQLVALERVVEMKGGWHGPQDFEEQAKWAQAVYQATSRQVRPSDLQTLLKRGGIALRDENPEALYGLLSGMVQETGPAALGAGIMSAYQNLVMGRTTAVGARHMADLGIVDPKKFEVEGGKFVGFQKGALKGEDEFRTNIVGWVRDVLAPALEHVAPEERSRTINSILTNRSAANMVSLIYMQLENLEKHQAVVDTVRKNIDVDKTMSTSVAGNEAELGAAAGAAMQGLATALTPEFLDLLKSTSQLLRDMSQLAHDHPIVAEVFTAPIKLIIEGIALVVKSLDLFVQAIDKVANAFAWLKADQTPPGPQQYLPSPPKPGDPFAPRAPSGAFGGPGSPFSMRPPSDLPHAQRQSYIEGGGDGSSTEAMALLRRIAAGVEAGQTLQVGQQQFGAVVRAAVNSGVRGGVSSGQGSFDGSRHAAQIGVRTV